MSEISEEEIIKQRDLKKIKEKRKKIVLIFIGVIIAIIILLGLIVLILSAVNNYSRNQTKANIDKETRRSYIYPEPDYDFNIFDDESYMKLDRGVWFNDGVVKTVMTDENYKNYTPELQFMYNVINIIINGDYEEYNKIFTDEYLKNAGDDLREEFTMQQLFEIELEYLDYGESEDGLYSDIQLIYRIRNNNGTFRNDLDFNDSGAIPVVYSLISDSSGIIKVTGLTTYYKYTTGLY
ncbi:MAG: hypothetical protein FWF92_01275 [Oscillospiraceae bacterium]|nr:hypothetical protein [Oscillospiraceae bacterium]